MTPLVLGDAIEACITLGHALGELHDGGRDEVCVGVKIDPVHDGYAATLYLTEDDEILGETRDSAHGAACSLYERVVVRATRALESMKDRSETLGQAVAIVERELAASRARAEQEPNDGGA